LVYAAVNAVFSKNYNSHLVIWTFEWLELAYFRKIHSNAKKRKGKNMNKKLLSLIIGVLVICVVMAAILVESSIAPAKQATKSMDFTVSGTNDCLRFLNSTVSVCYVPFTVEANQNWLLTVNCTKMPGGANGYTDIYIYNGYWDNGTNHVAMSADLCPILSQIQSVDFELKGTTCYNQTFGGATQQSYTVFFVLPPGGQATFHITYKPV
jgi:hypothetical protein